MKITAEKFVEITSEQYNVLNKFIKLCGFKGLMDFETEVSARTIKELDHLTKFDELADDINNLFPIHDINLRRTAMKFPSETLVMNVLRNMLTYCGVLWRSRRTSATIQVRLVPEEQQEEITTVKNLTVNSDAFKYCKLVIGDLNDYCTLPPNLRMLRKGLFIKNYNNTATASSISYDIVMNLTSYGCLKKMYDFILRCQTTGFHKKLAQPYYVFIAGNLVWQGNLVDGIIPADLSCLPQSIMTFSTVTLYIPNINLDSYLVKNVITLHFRTEQYMPPPKFIPVNNTVELPFTEPNIIEISKKIMKKNALRICDGIVSNKISRSPAVALFSKYNIRLYNRNVAINKLTTVDVKALCYPDWYKTMDMPFFFQSWYKHDNVPRLKPTYPLLTELRNNYGQHWFMLPGFCRFNNARHIYLTSGDIANITIHNLPKNHNSEIVPYCIKIGNTCYALKLIQNVGQPDFYSIDFLNVNMIYRVNSAITAEILNLDLSGHDTELISVKIEYLFPGGDVNREAPVHGLLKLDQIAMILPNTTQIIKKKAAPRLSNAN